MGRMSFDASVKIQYSGHWHSTKTDSQGNRRSGNGGVSGYIDHIARDVDRANGTEVSHGNGNIDPAYTEENETYFLNDAGEMELCTDSDQIRRAYQKRVGQVIRSSSKAVRKDAVTVRPIVTQIPAGSYGEDEEEDVIEAQYEWMCGQFGKDNIIAVGIHRDETSLHLHWMVMPVTERMERELLVDEDGKPLLTKKGNRRYGTPKPTGELTFNQKAFFPDADDLRSKHVSLREHMRGRGFDVETGNKPLEECAATYTDKYGNVRQKGLTPQELGKLTKKKNEANALLVENMAKKKELDRRENMINARADATDIRETVLNAKEDALNLKAKQIAYDEENSRRKAIKRKQELDRKQTEIDRDSMKLRESLDEVSRIHATLTLIMGLYPEVFYRRLTKDERARLRNNGGDPNTLGSENMEMVVKAGNRIRELERDSALIAVREEEKRRKRQQQQKTLA